MADPDYDLARWISTLERRLSLLETVEAGGYLFPFSAYNGQTSSVATSPLEYFAGTIPRNGTIIEFYTACSVATTNNGANFWSIEIRRLDTTAIIFTVTTAALTAGVFGVVSSTGRSDAITTGMLSIYIRCIKTGAPGNLSIINPAMIVI